MESIPFIPPGRATLSWTRDAEGKVLYTITSVGSRNGTVTFNSGMLLVTLMIDGRRSLSQIFDELIKEGLSIDDPALVMQICRLLERIDAIEMAWQIEALGEIRHICYAAECGECCEGHLVGNLSNHEIDRLIEYKEKLSLLEPDLSQGKAMMLVEGDEHRELAVNVVDGHCVFLAGDHLCAIHRQFGARMKPLVCQFFPIRIIETESGFRIGISPHCTLRNRSFLSAQPQQPDEIMAAMGLRRPPGDIVGLDPHQVRSLTPTPEFRHNLAQESYFLSLLTTDGIRLSDVIGSSTGTYRRGVPVSGRYLGEVARRLRRYAGRYEHTPLDTPGTVYGRGTRAFMAALSALPDEPPHWVEPPDPVRAFAILTLTQFVFLRETSRFPEVEVAFHVALIGLVGALWTAAPWTDSNGVSDKLGRHLAYWFRMNNVAGSYRLLFEGQDDYRAFVQLIEE